MSTTLLWLILMAPTGPQFQTIEKAYPIYISESAEEMCHLNSDNELVLAKGVTAGQCMKRTIDFMNEMSKRQSDSCAADKKIIFDAWERSLDKIIESLKEKPKRKP